MVVGEREGAAVPAQHGVEDLPHREQAALEGPLGHDEVAYRPIGGVADDHQDALASQASQVPGGDRRDVARSRQTDG